MASPIMLNVRLLSDYDRTNQLTIINRVLTEVAWIQIKKQGPRPIGSRNIDKSAQNCFFKVMRLPESKVRNDTLKKLKTQISKA